MHFTVLRLKIRDLGVDVLEAFTLNPDKGGIMCGRVLGTESVELLN